jgi:hypothetical protein
VGNRTKREADPQQTNVFDKPLSAFARRRDPDTSKQAAASVKGMRGSQKRILAMFERFGDMTDETLTMYLDEASAHTGLPRMSPSGVRSRRSELSKPNMDRLDEIITERMQGRVAKLTSPTTVHVPDEVMLAARQQLRTEGFRGVDGNVTTGPTLWDTGKRERLSSTGRMAIVWGVAR